MVSLVMLSGCLSKPPVESSTQPSSESSAKSRVWELRGRVGIRTSQKTNSFSLQWRQQADQYDIRLSSALGLSVAKIKGDESGVTIDIPNRGSFQSENATELLEQETGLKLPIESMQYWLRGEPAPNAKYKINASTLSQSGWQIEFIEYREGLPRRVSFTTPGVKVMLVVSSWQN